MVETTQSKHSNPLSILYRYRLESSAAQNRLYQRGSSNAEHPSLLQERLPLDRVKDPSLVEPASLFTLERQPTPIQPHLVKADNRRNPLEVPLMSRRVTGVFPPVVSSLSPAPTP